ncbi:MAG: hypothetical protein DHS20C01_28190 [marine bacterium B5-7]|nr:MAG: hypothetical protein DHS20C01_28190 [marine bacterium B5-7]
MGFLDIFKRKPKSAGIAKERLQILVSHERAERGAPSWLPDLKNDILEVIKKYVEVEQDAITVNLGRDSHREILELNIALPERDADGQIVGSTTAAAKVKLTSNTTASKANVATDTKANSPAVKNSPVSGGQQKPASGNTSASPNPAATNQATTTPSGTTQVDKTQGTQNQGTTTQGTKTQGIKSQGAKPQNGKNQASKNRQMRNAHTKKPTAKSPGAKT